MITQNKLKELLNYDPNTGLFIWKVSIGSRAKKGTIAGSVGTNGYLRIGIDGRDYRSNRLAWFYIYGVWPSFHIDHIDHDIKNNKIANLRDISNQQNIQNQILAHKSNKTTGLLGTHYDKRKCKYIAKIRINKIRIHLGSFDTAELAHKAYLKAKIKLHPTFAMADTWVGE